MSVSEAQRSWFPPNPITSNKVALRNIGFSACHHPAGVNQCTRNHARAARRSTESTTKTMRSPEVNTLRLCTESRACLAGMSENSVFIDRLQDELLDTVLTRRFGLMAAQGTTERSFRRQGYKHSPPYAGDAGSLVLCFLMSSGRHLTFPIHRCPMGERRLGMRSGSANAGRPASVSGNVGFLCSRFSS
jgi:hypothetical protein